jgi:hypothetical protein
MDLHDLEAACAGPQPRAVAAHAAPMQWPQSSVSVPCGTSVALNLRGAAAVAGKPRSSACEIYFACASNDAGHIQARQWETPYVIAHRAS